MAQALREKLGIDHPILDMDGHVVELVAATLPYLRDALGPELFRRYVERDQALLYAGGKPDPLAERMQTRTPQRGWWTQHTRHSFERALSMFPKLYYERMESLGIDYAVLYPTNALTICSVDDPELRQGLCHGYNEYFAAVYGPYADRLTAAGIVPMHDPGEAIRELEHCKELGIKVVGLPEGVLRPIERVLERPMRWMYPGQQAWFDVFGLDSIHDYDPVWQRASELGLAVSFHGGLSPRPGICTSPSNFSFNHVGMFMQSMYPLCKALFMGGVATRFPDMKFSFLECGVSWAVPLLADMTEHWERRSPAALSDFDPALFEIGELVEWAERYGEGLIREGEKTLREALTEAPIFSQPPDERDDWAALDAADQDAFRERFAGSFYFGCEADDRTVGIACARHNGLGIDLNATLGSDIGHWDVAHAEHVVPEAFTMVEDGILTPDEFRGFAFDNAVSFLSSADPNFFSGTAIERAAVAST